MAKLTQVKFVKRLKYIMDDVLHLRGSYGDVAREAGTTPGSLSRWRNSKYKSGPPRQGELRNLEPVLGLPSGSLLANDETWKRAANAVKRRRAEEDAAKGTVGSYDAVVTRVGHADRVLDVICSTLKASGVCRHLVTMEEALDLVRGTDELEALIDQEVTRRGHG